MRRTFSAIVVLVAVSVVLVSCGTGYPNYTQPQAQASFIPFRAFVSNSLFPNGTANVPVLNIVDATQDILSFSTVNLAGTVFQAGLMAVSPDLSRTLVFSPQGNAIAVVNNATEGMATVSGGTTGVPAITLPGLTESMFVANNNTTAYAAVPSAPVIGQAPGAVIAMNIGTGAITATIPVAGAHFIVGSADGNRILVFSDNSDNVTVISTVLIGSNEDPRTTVSGFDRPMWGIFSDNATAYVFNCGPECGGKAAGITTFNIGSPGPGPVTPVSAATYGLLSGRTLYVAGTPPRTPCGAGTAATSCGTLNMVDVNSMRRTNPSPIIITDGYHYRMQMGANGQLFIGARGCTNVNVEGGEVRGCLSIFNTNNSSVVIPPQIGDATGIQPISGRNVVYVCEGGVFQIYDTTTDQLLFQPAGTIDIVGQSIDVKVVDPPLN